MRTDEHLRLAVERLPEQWKVYAHAANMQGTSSMAFKLAARELDSALSEVRALREALAQARAENEKLAHDSYILRHAGIVEIAVANESGSVSDYMNHWESRALKAEGESAELDTVARELLDEARRQLAELKEAQK